MALGGCILALSSFGVVVGLRILYTDLFYRSVYFLYFLLVFLVSSDMKSYDYLHSRITYSFTEIGNCIFCEAIVYSGVLYSH